MTKETLIGAKGNSLATLKLAPLTRESKDSALIRNRAFPTEYLKALFTSFSPCHNCVLSFKTAQGGVNYTWTSHFLAISEETGEICVVKETRLRFYNTIIFNGEDRNDLAYPFRFGNMPAPNSKVFDSVETGEMMNALKPYVPTDKNIACRTSDTVTSSCVYMAGMEPKFITANVLPLLRKATEYLHGGVHKQLVSPRAVGLPKDNYDGGYAACSYYPDAGYDIRTNWMHPFGSYSDHRRGNTVGGYVPTMFLRLEHTDTHGRHVPPLTDSAITTYEVVSFAGFMQDFKLCENKDCDSTRMKLFSHIASSTRPLTVRLFRGPRILFEYGEGDARQVYASCMTKEKAPYTELYAANPQAVALAVAYDDQTPVLRCLVWDHPTDKNAVYMDRVYPDHSGGNVSRMVTALKKALPDHTITQIYSTKDVSIAFLLKPGPNHFTPYLDSFEYGQVVTTKSGEQRFLVFRAGFLDTEKIDWACLGVKHTGGGLLNLLRHVPEQGYSDAERLFKMAGASISDYEVHSAGSVAYPKEWQEEIALARAERKAKAQPGSMSVERFRAYITSTSVAGGSGVRGCSCSGTTSGGNGTAPDGSAGQPNELPAGTLSIFQDAAGILRSLSVPPGDPEGPACTCDDCGEDVEDEDALYTISGGGRVCSSCLDDSYTYVENIGEYFHNDDTVYSENYGHSYLYDYPPRGWTHVANSDDSNELFEEDCCERGVVSNELLAIGENLGRAERRRLSEEPVQVLDADGEPCGWDLAEHLFESPEGSYYQCEEDYVAHMGEESEAA